MAETEEFEVRATEPVVFDRPFRTLRRLKVALIAFGVAVLVCTAVGSFVGYQLAAHRANAQISELNASRAENRAKLQQQAAANSAQIEAQREVFCTLLQRVAPDKAIDQERKAFRCGPYLPPGAPGRQQTVGPIAPQPPVLPAPSPTPKPVPRPSPTSAHPTVAPSPPRSTPVPPPRPSPSHLICVLGICL